MKNKTKIIFVSVATLVLLAVVFFSFFGKRNEAIEPIADIPKDDVTDLPPATDNDYVIEQVPIENPTLPPAPSLDRALNSPTNMSKEARDIYEIKIKQTIERLKKDSTSFGDWIDLGIYRKGLEDFEGARDAWQYASVINPSNPIPHVNLGDIYAYYLRDKNKAEASLKKAVSLDPSNPDFYLRLALFYVEIADDKAKAISILEDGLKVLQGNLALTFELQKLRGIDPEESSPKPQ